MSSETDAILYSRPNYPGWAGVCDFDPNTEPVEVHADTLPEEVQAILALTPGLPEETDWATREALAATVADAGAKGLADSWWAFAPQALNVDATGDVWA